MCGIAGIFRTDLEPVPPPLIDAMIDTLRHRGPDGDGSFFRPGIAFGHTRLAIIDLSAASDQPIRDEASGVTMIFNGEIYNYVELREELRALGHTFRSNGDGEVIVRAYLEWGAACLSRLNGMFAIALWDDRNRKLLLARDRFGEKPLYIARTHRGLVFASEMKAILAVRPELRVPNRRVLFRYLSRGDLDQDQETFFEGIESLPGGRFLLIDSNGCGEPAPFWRAQAAEVPSSRADAIEGFRELFFDAVRIRLRSDVPVGSSLSGGLDSSSVVCTINAQKQGQQELHQKTFTARFRSKKLDEGKFVHLVTRHVDAEMHETWIEPERFLDEFQRLQWHQEEPIASSSPFAQWLVMRLARENNTTVLLDGQGADEVLAGYDQAHGMFWANYARRGRFDHVARETVSFLRRYHRIRQPSLFAAYYSLPDGFRDRLVERYYRSANVVSRQLHDEFAPDHVETYRPFDDRLRNELVRWQVTTQLPEFLRYADRNSMAFSREVRLPFLDHRLVEYSFGLPNDLLLHDAVTKVVLRESMRGIVPEGILTRRDKLAYSPPQRQWLRGPLRGWMASLLERAEKRPEFYNPDRVRDVREHADHHAGGPVGWRIASTQAWLETMIDRPPVSPAPGAEPIALSW